MSTSFYIALGVYILFAIGTLMLFGIGGKPTVKIPEDWAIPFITALLWPVVLIGIVAYAFFYVIIEVIKITVYGFMLLGFIIDASITRWRLKRRVSTRKEK